MNYTEAMNEGLVEIPIKDVISSLQGPLIRTDQPSEVTSVVKYYHLLPYYDILSDWISRETHYHGFLPSLRHLAVVDKDNWSWTNHGHVFSNSDQKDQVLCMPTNNTTKVENKDTNYKKKNNPLSREKSSVVDCTRKTRANDSLLDLDRQLDISDQIVTDKSTLNEYRNRTNHAVINIKSPVESCRNASSPITYIPINIKDNASLNQHQQSSASEGMISRETIISDICISKRENNNLQDAKSSPSNGCPEKELDDLCYELGWTLPQYSVHPSILDGRVEDVNFYSGMFQATVTLKGLNSECTVNGDMKSSRRAARSSAAATHMLSKLLSMARSQAQARNWVRDRLVTLSSSKAPFPHLEELGNPSDGDRGSPSDPSPPRAISSPLSLRPLARSCSSSSPAASSGSRKVADRIVKLFAVDPEGSKHEVIGLAGQTLLRALINAGLIDPASHRLEEMEACSAECEVHISQEWLDKLPPTSYDERYILTRASRNRILNKHARLGCQVVLQPELQGMVVAVPEPKPWDTP